MISTRPYTVFVSYTGNDLENHAAAVNVAIRKLRHVAIDHKDSGATGERSVDWCMSQVDNADILVVLVAYRYGWIPSPEEGGDGHTSITWMEVERACKQGKPVLPYLVDEEAVWPPKHIEQIRKPEIAEPLSRFKAELKRTVASFFSTPDSLDGPVSRDIARAVSRLEETRMQAEGTHPSLTSAYNMLKRPQVYISDLGVSQELIMDVADRLERVGFLVRKPNYSGYFIDIKTELYEQCDFVIIAMGPAAKERYGHVRQELQLLRNQIHVYFEPVDMSRTGYGAPLSPPVLSLEDWRRRPASCLAELLICLKRELLRSEWTSCRTDLPDIEIVSLDYWHAADSRWRRPLERAGFALRDQEKTPEGFPLPIPSSELGGARFSLFVWGVRASQEDVSSVLKRAGKGAAIVALVDQNVLVPDSVKEACEIFDLRKEELNRSVVGTDEWERMLLALRSAVNASNVFARSLEPGMSSRADAD